MLIVYSLGEKTIVKVILTTRKSNRSQATLWYHGKRIIGCWDVHPWLMRNWCWLTALSLLTWSTINHALSIWSAIPTIKPTWHKSWTALFSGWMCGCFWFQGAVGDSCPLYRIINKNGYWSRWYTIWCMMFLTLVDSALVIIPINFSIPMCYSDPGCDDLNKSTVRF